MVKKISKLCFSFLMISVFMFSSIDCQASSVFQDVYGDCSDEQEVEPVTFDDVNVDSPELDVPDYLGAVYDEYKDDQQFQMMLDDYGEEYAIDFLKDVNSNNAPRLRGGGGNTCYQYVTCVKQSEHYNCGSASVLQSLYGMGAASNVRGATNNDKMKTLDSEYNVTSQGMIVYQVRDALNKYKPKGIGNYVYARGNSVSEGQFEDRIANSLMSCRPVVLHAMTGTLTYYGGKNLRHYLSLDYVNRSTKTVRIVDCNYNSKYLGAHNVPLSEAYSTINIVDRYFIY
ncbi:MAG: hypothetical protein IKW81_00925 [Pseudobutyrivibrio sp.]|nr:hypothetical protein [Pseudobutyrivibrio sp.]